MIETIPKVYLIGEPKIDINQMAAYLREVGGMEWYERVVAPVVLTYGHAGATELVEFCGRLCYRSWEPGLNKNVTRVRKDTAKYLLNILTVGHGSVIAHAHFTFALHDVSRVLTAELNRHTHTDISEQSLRFVRLDELRFRTPPVLPEEVQRAGKRIVEEVEAFLAWAAGMCGLENEGDELGLAEPLPFAQKKIITSALRRYAPMGISTEEAWTCSLRGLRHIIEVRTDRHAEEEIRIVANQIGEIMEKKAPYFFADYGKEWVGNDMPPEWVTDNVKV